MHVCSGSILLDSLNPQLLNLVLGGFNLYLTPLTASGICADFYSIGGRMDTIDKCFSKRTVEEILSALVSWCQNMSWDFFFCQFLYSYCVLLFYYDLLLNICCYGHEQVVSHCLNPVYLGARGCKGWWWIDFCINSVFEEGIAYEPQNLS